jgi:hypothetical protein
MQQNSINEQVLFDQSFTVPASLSGDFGKAVKLNSDREVVLAGAGDNAIGILQSEPDLVSVRDGALFVRRLDGDV